MATIPRSRRRHVVEIVRRQAIHDQPLTEDAKLLYVVGALVADDEGHLSQERLKRALRDATVVQIARSILALTRPEGAA